MTTKSSHYTVLKLSPQNADQQKFSPSKFPPPLYSIIPGCRTSIFLYQPLSTWIDFMYKEAENSMYTYMYTTSLHEGVKISYLCRSESRTRKLSLHYGDFVRVNSTSWRAEQLVNLSRCYVSATPVQRLLNQELVGTTILWATRSHFKSCPDVGCIKQFSSCYHYLQWSSF